MRSSACWTRPAVKSASRFSLTALTLPGRVVMSVFPIVPATGRERAAKGVWVRDVERMM